MEISKYIRCKEAITSFQDLEKKECFWEMIFRRDFPFHTKITKEFRKWYHHYERLTEISIVLGFVEIQEEWLEYINQKYDFKDWHNFGFYEWKPVTYSCFTRDVDYIFEKGLQFICNFDHHMKQDHLFYRNGKITKKKEDYYYSSLVYHVTYLMPYLIPMVGDFWNEQSDHFGSDRVQRGIVNVFFSGNDQLYRLLNSLPTDVSQMSIQLDANNDRHIHNIRLLEKRLEKFD